MNRRRGIDYLNILRAECYIKQSNAEYEQAAMLLSDVLENGKNIKHHINYVTRLYKLLVASPYGNAPHVAGLDMALGKLKKLK